MQTICETHHFHAKAQKLLSQDEYEELIATLAVNPEAGDVIKGTGGVRKLRLAREGGGKSGGFRVIYFFYTKQIPLYLFDVYAKNAKDNLSKAERNQLAAITAGIKQAHKKG